MAWLEGLAAKQGVSEDELLTSPEERPEELPSFPDDLSPTQLEAEDQPEAVEPIAEVDDAGDSMDWLDGLAAERRETARRFRRC
jgi:hypothetical protein